MASVVGVWSPAPQFCILSLMSLSCVMLAFWKFTDMLFWYLFAKDSEDVSGPNLGVVRAPKEEAVQAVAGSNSGRFKQIEHLWLFSLDPHHHWPAGRKCRPLHAPPSVSQMELAHLLPTCFPTQVTLPSLYVGLYGNCRHDQRGQS